MEYFIYPYLFIFGVLVGSFLNVVILRFDTGKSIVRDRSRCFSCDKTLTWHELIPVVSFLLLRGRCARCKTRISWQYPVVEGASGVLFVLAYMFALNTTSLSFLVVSFMLHAILFSLYLVICVYDIRHKIIPDLFSFGAVGIALLYMLAEYLFLGAYDTGRLVAGVVLFFFFFFFWFVSGGRWMGLGDAKLAISVGIMLGIWQGIAGILLAFWIGAAASIVVIVVQKLLRSAGELGFKSEIPFGPYILIGFFIAYVFSIDIQTMLLHLPV